MRRLSALCALLCATLLLSSTAAVADDPLPDRGLLTGEISVDGHGGSSGVVMAQRVDESYVAWQEQPDNDDRYEMSLQPGQYRVWFSPRHGPESWEYYPGVRTRSEAQVITVRAGEVIPDIDFDLTTDAGSIAGTVIYAPGTSLSNWPPTMTPYYLDGDEWRPVPAKNSRSTVKPSYLLEALPPGTYKIRYETRDGHGDTASGFLGGTDDAASATPVEVRSGEMTTVDMTPRKGATISGRVVTAEGRPVAGVEVYPLRRLEGEWDRGDEVRTDERGRYSLPRLDVDDYVLQLVPPRPFDEVFSGDVQRDATQPFAVPSAPDDAARITTRPGVTTRLGDQVVQRQGVLEGTVVDQDQGRPVAGVEVVAQQVINVGATSVRVGEDVTATTDADGRYSFGRLPQAPYLVELVDPWNGGARSSYPGAFLNPERFPGSFSNTVFVRSAATTAADARVHGYMPTLSDTTPVVGQSVSAVPPSHQDGGAPDGSSWRWRRDGAVIAGATSSSYRATSKDRGARLTAEIVLPTRDGRLVHSSPASRRVSVARPVVTVAGSSPSAGRVTLTVRGTAPDVPTSLLDGTVEVVHVNTGRRTTGSMVDGSLTVSLTGQPKGIQTYTARFLAQPDRFAASPLGQRAVTVR